MMSEWCDLLKFTKLRPNAECPCQIFLIREVPFVEELHRNMGQSCEQKN